MIIGTLYALFVMSRYNFTAIAPHLLDAFGWTKKDDLGLLETIMPFFYGLSVIFNATIVDRIGGRKAYLIGSAGVVVANLLFGAGHFMILQSPEFQDIVGANGATVHTLVRSGTFVGNLSAHQMALIMSGIWVVNAYFQSFGAMAIIRINANWFTSDERGRFSAIFGVLIRMGIIFAFSGVPLIADHTAWYWGFWIPAVLVALFAVAEYFFVAERPEDIGYPAVLVDKKGKKKPTTFELIQGVVTDKNVLVFALISIMIGFVRRSVVDTWWPTYFKEVIGVSGSSFVAQTAAVSIAVFGIAGGFALGPWSDRLKRRAPVIAVGFVGMAASLALFRLIGTKTLGGWEAVLCLSLASFFVNGVHGVIMGAASMDLGGKRGSASVAGIFDGAQYFFAAPFTGLLVGHIISGTVYQILGLNISLGWETWKVWPIPFALIGALLTIFVWNVRSEKSGGH